MMLLKEIRGRGRDVRCQETMQMRGTTVSKCSSQREIFSDSWLGGDKCSESIPVLPFWEVWNSSYWLVAQTER